MMATISSPKGNKALNQIENTKNNNKSERKKLVHGAIAELPEDYREVIMLRDIEELSTSEVAETLNISEGAVRVRLHRARTALRTLLNAYFT